MDAAAKQQIVEKIKQSNNILVTVSNGPSVDQLAACIGLTLFLNKLEKHTTAVFSGQIPSTLEFLQPEKTLQPTTDSLRDFIISLDKAKADKLRYKVEDDVVRIFITPYRTSITQQDLVFSEGDFNVEVVLALGVRDKTQLDAAITAHGKILHDATVIAVNAGEEKIPPLGQINWQEPTASSLCEMLVSISEAFGTGLIDNQMATAFLTGIVAETDRFSNTKTSPKVMTMSAQLMAAGANQQLIVSKLEPPENLGTPPAQSREPKNPPAAPSQPGELVISHDEPVPLPKEPNLGEIHIDEKGNIQSPKTEAPPQTLPPLPVPAPLAATVPNVKPASAPPPELLVNPIPDLAAPKGSVVPTPQPPSPYIATPETLPKTVPPAQSAEPVVVPPVLPSPAPPAEPVVVPPTVSVPPSPPVAATAPTLPLPEVNVPKPSATPVQESKPHALLDPANAPPTISSPFTADTTPTWSSPFKTEEHEPIITPPKHEAVVPTHGVLVSPPSAVPKQTLAGLEGSTSGLTATVDTARSAVDKAISAPPAEGLAQVIKPTVESANKKPNDELPPPPPVPPPFRLDSGAVVPSYPTPNSSKGIPPASVL